MLFDPRCVRELKTKPWEVENRQSGMTGSENADDYLCWAVWLNHSLDLDEGLKMTQQM